MKKHREYKKDERNSENSQENKKGKVQTNEY